MSKPTKTEDKTVETVETVETEVVKLVTFKSNYKNYLIAGTNIVFRDGLYETADEDEIEQLRKNSSVEEVKDKEAGE